LAFKPDPANVDNMVSS